MNSEPQTDEFFPIFKRMSTEFTTADALGEDQFTFPEGGLFDSLFKHPERHTFTLPDFIKSLNLSLLFAEKNNASSDSTLKIFSALAVIYQHTDIIFNSDELDQQGIYFSFFSLDTIALLVYNNQSNLLNTMLTLLRNLAPMGTLHRTQSLYFFQILASRFTTKQSNTFFSYTNEFLLFFSHKIASIEFLNDGSPTMNKYLSWLTDIYIDFFAFRFIPTTDMNNHPLYETFFLLSTDCFDACYTRLSRLHSFDPLQTDELMILLTKLFAHPYFCSLAFKNNHLYFLQFCDVKHDIDTHPQLFS